MIKKILTDILTCKDNATFDNGRVLLFLAVICFLIFTAIDVLETHTFEYQEFGIGFGILLAGGGVNLKLKETSEPK